MKALVSISELHVESDERQKFAALQIQAVRTTAQHKQTAYKSVKLVQFIGSNGVLVPSTKKNNHKSCFQWQVPMPVPTSGSHMIFEVKYLTQTPRSVDHQQCMTF